MKLLPVGTGLFAKLDDADYEVLHKFNYSLQHKKDGVAYVKRWCAESQLHRLITRDLLDVPIGSRVIHIDGDQLNLQRRNLKLATRTQELAARVEHRQSKTSEYRGVSWDKSRQKWVVQIKGKHLGRFNDEKTAALTYDKEALKLFGEFASTNIIEEPVLVGDTTAVIPATPDASKVRKQPRRFKDRAINAAYRDYRAQVQL